MMTKKKKKMNSFSFVMLGNAGEIYCYVGEIYCHAGEKILCKRKFSNVGDSRLMRQS